MKRNTERCETVSSYRTQRKVIVMFTILLFIVLTVGCGNNKEKGIQYEQEPESIIYEYSENTIIFEKEKIIFKEEVSEEKILKTNEEIADEVIYGSWGLGEERVKKLTDAGYDANEIQKLVDSKMPKPQIINYSYSNYNSYDTVYASYNSCSDVVSVASSYVGWLPYVSGGADLSYGCDCCGFVMCVYAVCGYNVGRTVESQACAGVSVPIDYALPGDIVIYGGHSAVYAGNGTIIHSPVPGRCVEYASLYIMPIYDVRRIA